MKQTENLGLNLPEGPDNYNVKDYNDNFEIIDEKLKYLSDNISGAVEELTVTENGTYTAEPGTTYNPVHVQVTPTLEDITITQNGEYQASEGFDGLGKVIANVGEPDEKVVSEFEFSRENYDLIRSIIGDAPSNTSLILGAPYNAAISGGEMVFNNTGSAYFHPCYYLNELKNYEIDIEFGTVDNNQGGWELGGFKIYAQNFAVWLNFENNTLTAFNSSGSFAIPNRSLADFSNKTIKFLVTHRISLTNDTLTEVSILFEGETTPIKLGDIDNKLPYYPFIGSLSGNAIKQINIKKFKIIEKKWTPAANRELLKNAEEEKETEETKKAELLKNKNSEEGQKGETE